MESCSGLVPSPYFYGHRAVVASRRSSGNQATTGGCRTEDRCVIGDHGGETEKPCSSAAEMNEGRSWELAGARPGRNG